MHCDEAAGDSVAGRYITMWRPLRRESPFSWPTWHGAAVSDPSESPSFQLAAVRSRPQGSRLFQAGKRSLSRVQDLKERETA